MSDSSEMDGADLMMWTDSDLLRQVLDDPQVAGELSALGASVPASEPRTVVKRPRRGPRFVAGVMAASVCALGVGGVAWAVVDPLNRGYIGDEKLIDTTTWGPEWRARIDAYEWPTGFDSRAFIDPQVEDGRERPDGIPASNLDAEVLALNACAWFAAYERRHGSGRDDALRGLTTQLDRVEATGGAGHGAPYFAAISETVKNLPSDGAAAIRSYPYLCDGIYRDATAAVR